MLLIRILFLFNLNSIFIQLMSIFKTPDLCNDIMLGDRDNLNKELVNGIAVDLKN